jgi:UDP-N-acetylglucosamine 3-dehydrogenase
MTTTPVRIGVIGLGQIALRSHLPGYRRIKKCKISAVYSSRESHSRKVAAQYGIPHIYNNWRLLLESGQVDAVSICTPNFTHLPIALKAFQKGIHVLMEKPMALSPRESLRLIQEAQDAKRVLMVHHNMRFEPAVRTVKRILQKKTIGHVFAFKGSLTHRGPKVWNPKAKWFFDHRQSGGGALMDLGPHLFDLLCYLLQGKPRVAGAVAAFPKNSKAGNSEIHCSCLLRFKGSAVGTATVGWADTTYQNHIYFFGTEGTLCLNLAKGDPVTLEFRKRPGKIHPPLLKRDSFPSLYEHFINCVKTKGKSWVSGEDGLKTMELIEEAYHFMRLENQRIGSQSTHS